MGRKHWMKDRVRITRRKPTINHGIVENLTRGIVEERPELHQPSTEDLASFEQERDITSDWIPARLRLPGGDETQDVSEVKVDLGVHYELVLYGWDENGVEVCPKQSDEFIIKYSRDWQLQGTSGRMRIIGTIQEVRKRSRLYSYIIPVVLNTEF